MKNILLIVALFIGFTSCDNLSATMGSPTAKAQEVCNCIRKNFEDKKIGSMVRECNEIREKHTENLKGDALKKFEDALEECSGDMLEEGLNNLFQ